MWRALFTAVGLSLCILGAECMVVERAVFAVPNRQQGPADALTNASIGGGRELKPPEWAPWTLLSAGAVVMLYAATATKS